MKAVIFAGGLGTRISQESVNKPKPMVEIGSRPLLWHVMKIYARYGIKDFVVCLGYKGYVIKEYFLNYYRHTTDLTIDLATDTHHIHSSRTEDWRVTLVDTEVNTETGGRLKRVAPYLKGEAFCVTYGDGLADIDISKEIAFHRRHGKLATVTAVQPPGRFGRLVVGGTSVESFEEKPRGEFGWVNGGFFVFEHSILDRLNSNSPMLEKALLPELVRDKQLEAFYHDGFWMSCDTMRDKMELEKVYASGDVPWLIETE